MDDAKMLTFANKTEIINRILSCEKYVHEKAKNRLICRIDRIRKLRNVVSHSKIDNSQEQILGFNGNDICFRKYRFMEGEKKPEKIVINSKIIEEFDAKVTASMNIMDEILMKMR